MLEILWGNALGEHLETSNTGASASGVNEAEAHLPDGQQPGVSASEGNDSRTNNFGRNDVLPIQIFDFPVFLRIASVVIIRD